LSAAYRKVRDRSSGVDRFSRGASLSKQW